MSRWQTFKKMFREAFITAMIVATSICVSFAWFVTAYTGYLDGITVKPAKQVAGNILIAKSGSSNFAANLSTSVNTSLYPCKSTDGKTFQKEDGTVVTDNGEFVYKEIFYVKSSNGSVKFKVASIDVTGNDAINKALRVSVQLGSQVYVYAPVSGASETLTAIGTQYTQPLTVDAETLVVRVWYSGLDASCTDAYLSSAQGASIKINFEGN